MGIYSLGAYGYLSQLLGMHPITGIGILLGIIGGVSLGDRYSSRKKIEKYLVIVSLFILFIFSLYGLNIFLGIDDIPFIKYQLAIGIVLTLFVTDLFQFKPDLFEAELKGVTVSWILYTLFIGTVYNFSRENFHLKDIVELSAGFFILLFTVIRGAKLFLKGILGQKILLIGEAERVEKMRKIILSNRTTMYDVAAIVIEEQGKISISGEENRYRDEIEIFENNCENSFENNPRNNLNNSSKNSLKNDLESNYKFSEIRTTYEKLGEIEISNGDEAIILMPDLKAEEEREILKILDGKFRRVRYTPNINGVFTFNSKVEDFDGELLITASENYFNHGQLMLKRAFDIIGSLVGIALLAPIYLWAKSKIMREDSGPVLFAHERVGVNLEKFRMYKFRTMFIDAEARLEEMLQDEEVRREFYRTFKLRNDPRITKIGEFLRRTSLDEFPQFINVLRGEMSIVGPRPVVEKEVEMYYGTETGRKIFLMKPGITGMWQSRGRSDIESYDERIKLDLYYLRNWSLILDLKIIMRTIRMVLLKKGAY